MAPFPQLKKVCRGQWPNWQDALAKEIGGDTAKLQSYLPMYLKKNSAALKIPAFWIELADYEWSIQFVKDADRAVLKSADSPPAAKGSLRVNPFVRILKLKYDIKGWIHGGASGEPKEKHHLMVISKTARFEASFAFAAVIDELDDGPVERKKLEEILGAKHGARDWSAAIATLINGGAVLAS